MPLLKNGQPALPLFFSSLKAFKVGSKIFQARFEPVALSNAEARSVRRFQEPRVTNSERGLFRSGSPGSNA